MNAREHFENTVVPNYNDFVQSPSDFRLLENALFSMNTVAERLALERREYGQVARGVLYGEAQKIRDDLSGLATPTGRRSPTSISRMNRADGRCPVAHARRSPAHRRQHRQASVTTPPELWALWISVIPTSSTMASWALTAVSALFVAMKYSFLPKVK